VAAFWLTVASVAAGSGAAVCEVRAGSLVWARLTHDGRTLYVPVPTSSVADEAIEGNRRTWLERKFRVSELVKRFPGEAEAIRRYAPTEGEYAGTSYPLLYSDKTTQFDGTVVLEQDGMLHEKLLLEYKSGKSSKGRHVDGNAHERLSFQMMQYLEVAPRYTRCSLIVMANGAFIHYRNKYHVSFSMQSDRLKNFAWFDMHYLCACEQYLRLANGLVQWLLTGDDWRRDTTMQFSK
jgi:hypothetical protein